MLIFVDESEWPKPSVAGGYTVWAAIALQPQLSKAFSRELFNLERKFWRINEPHEFEIKGRMLLNKRALTRCVTYVSQPPQRTNWLGLHFLA